MEKQASLQELLEQEKALRQEFSAVERDVILECGALDLTVFQARITASGLKAEWDALQAKIKQARSGSGGV
jgi:hypothetical protein